MTISEGIIWASVLFLGAQAASAQDWARVRLEKSPRHQEWVTVKHDGRSVETFVVYPEAKEKKPVVLVIHEIFGMTDWVEDMADQIAAMGYIAVAPDLLSGSGPKGGRSSSFANQGQAIEATSRLDSKQVTADLKAVADYALKLPSSSGKLFSAGFCWGGGESFRFATNHPDLAAALVFYGGSPDKESIARIKGSVFGFYAGNDERVDATVPPAQAAARAADVVFEAVTYEGAGHGFMRAGEAPDAKPADKQARQYSLERMKSVLDMVSLRGY
jgi:carboxymethylenebutenolidase